MPSFKSRLFTSSCKTQKHNSSHTGDFPRIHLELLFENSEIDLLSIRENNFGTFVNFWFIIFLQKATVHAFFCFKGELVKHPVEDTNGFFIHCLLWIGKTMAVAESSNTLLIPFYK